MINASLSQGGGRMSIHGFVFILFCALACIIIICFALMLQLMETHKEEILCEMSEYNIHKKGTKC